LSVTHIGMQLAGGRKQAKSTAQSISVALT